MYDLRDEHRRDPFEEDPHCCALEHVTRKKIDGPDGYLEQEISNELRSARGECSRPWLTQVSYNTLDSNGGEGAKYESTIVEYVIVLMN